MDMVPSRESLVATYEELNCVPSGERVTHYFGDYGGHVFDYGVTEAQKQAAYEKALDAIEMTDKEYRSHPEFMYRCNIRAWMNDCIRVREMEEMRGEPVYAEMTM